MLIFKEKIVIWILIFCCFFLNSCTIKNYKEKIVCLGAGWEIPPAFNGNPWSMGGQTGLNWFVFEPLFFYVPLTGKFMPQLGLKFQEQDNNKTIIINLRKNVFWQNGIQFSAKDVACTFYLMWLHNLISKLKDIEIIDQSTIKIKLIEPLTPREKVIILTQPINSPYHLYGKWFKNLNELMKKSANFFKKQKLTEDELVQRKYIETAKKKIRESLYKFRPEFPCGTGPFKYKVITNSEAILVKNLSYWNVKQVNINKVKVIRWPSNEVIWASLISGDLDVVHPATPYDVTQRILELNPKIKLVTVTDFKEYGFIFNLRKEPMKDINFRKAFAYIIDKDMLRKVSYYYGKTTQNYNTGIIETLKNKWLNKNFVDKYFTKYTYNPEVASEILQKAGYKKDKQGFWHMPSGKQIKIEIITYSGNTDWVIGAEVAVNQLREFGIFAEVRTIEPSLIGSLLMNGKFDIAAQFTTDMSKSVNPLTSYNSIFSNKGMLKKITSFPEKVKSFNNTSVNVGTLVNQLFRASTLEEKKEIIKHLAYITNEYLPYYSIYEKQLMIFVQEGKRVYNWPQNSDPIWSAATCGAEFLYSHLIGSGTVKSIFTR